MSLLALELLAVPDVESGRRLYGLKGLSDADVARAMYNKRRDASGEEQLPPWQMRIICAVALLHAGTPGADAGEPSIHVLGDSDAGESGILQALYDLVDGREDTRLVAWGGVREITRLLRYRCLLNGCLIPVLGPANRPGKGRPAGPPRWGRGMVEQASLAEISTLAGLPTQWSASSHELWRFYRQGESASIRRVAIQNALNRWLLFLMELRTTGELERAGFEAETARLAGCLEQGGAEMSEFLGLWQAGTNG